MTNLLPEGIDGIYIVVRNQCNQQFTYMINGPNVECLGNGDLHEVEYDEYEISDDFTNGEGTFFATIKECRNYRFHIYPSTIFLNECHPSNTETNKDSKWHAIGAFIIFLICGIVFLIYNMLVERRKKELLTYQLKELDC